MEGLILSLMNPIEEAGGLKIGWKYIVGASLSAAVLQAHYKAYSNMTCFLKQGNNTGQGIVFLHMLLGDKHLQR